MKKLTALLIAFAIALTFCACSFNPAHDDSGTATVVIMEETPVVYTVDLSKIEITNGAFSLLDYLAETEGLYMKKEESAYGAYITAVGSIATDASGYVSIFTSVQSQWDVASGWGVERTYNDTKVMTASVGISQLSVFDGTVIYFEYIKY